MVAISLRKQRVGLELRKVDAPMPWRATLRWQAIPLGSLLRTLSHPRGIDLDLGALIERPEGQFAVVQPLGNSFGALDAPPFVQLIGDDRYGTSADGESLWINAAPQKCVKRLILFVWLCAGAPCFAATQAQVTLYGTGNPQTRSLIEPQSSLTFCAVAQLVPPYPWQWLLTYFPSQQALAIAYGFGKQVWHPHEYFGKSPWPL